MKFSRIDDFADLLYWYPVKITDGQWLKDMHGFLTEYDSNGKYTIVIRENTWWFEKSEDALIFRLKFG